VTKDQLRLPAWAIPILLSGLVAAVVAWSSLASKEDASAHAADVSSMRKDHTAELVQMRTIIREAENQRDQDFIRDSAWKADAMRILLDVQRQVKK
jgi:hypothetical protein